MDKDAYFEKLKKTLDSEQTTEKKEVSSEDDLQKIRTFKSDIADAVKGSNISYSKVAIQQEEHERKVNEASSKPQSHIGKNILFFVLSIFLLLLTCATGYGIYTYVQSHNSNQAEIAVSPQIISTDSEKKIVLPSEDRVSIIKALQSEKKNPIEGGTIEKIDLELASGIGSSTPLTSQDLFGIFGSNIPGETLRTFQNSYLLGLYGNGKTNDTFVVLTIQSYDDAYGGMLGWEKFMKDDLQNFLITPFTETSTSSVQIKIASTTISSTSSTSTLKKNDAASTGSTSTLSATSTIIVTTTTIPVNNDFKDAVVANKDVRVLKDTEGNTLFLYSFIDKQTLVLATSESALNEIENRLISSKRTQ